MGGQRNSHGKRPHSQSDYDDNGRSKRRSNGDDRGYSSIGSDDTVYRYLCPSKKIGSIMGRGGEIVKQLRSETKAKIRIGETVQGCDERVVTIHSTSEETNDFDMNDDRVCPATDALFKVHDRVVADDQAAEVDSDREEALQVTVRLLVPSDQIGCIIGKGGQIVQTIRSDTASQIRILKDNHIPACALSNDELVQISGEPSNVRKALFQIAARLHDNPSRSQHLLSSSTPNVYPSGGSLTGPPGGAPFMGLTQLVGAYGGYKGEGGFYAGPRDESPPKEFSLRLICPTANIGGVIGKGGAAINQIRQETGAAIKVDSSKAEADDCIISISAKEVFEDTFSPAIEAALLLQPRCSERIVYDSGFVSYTTRLLVPSSRIGCLIGKGGAIITEIRRISRANIRIISKEDLPKVAEDDDEMVQISAEIDLAKDALLQVISRLRANLFEREGAMSTVVPVLPYLPVAPDVPEVSKYDSRDSKGHGRGHDDLPAIDAYGSYTGLQGRSGGEAYGAYGGYSSGRSGSSGGSRHNPASRWRDYNY
ncbi:putative K domain-containing protein [Helianthus annuus]|uniref:K domain-containing protein n=1 Tax=Helianthus annuus TaxID=4232 RepID=A0A251TY42_HELAN|nr:KH domain-containing protein At4g18375 [Helianthus annuus]XP_021983274.1 KH domain-containing protein At4g18375 [Helianthus annuus]XP_035833659.1 KH domain-containing protein At4g18375 [Helianthus annuus]KAF5792029.1 putative K domain-containing protein [Helianthus annuus]KAJ0527018.1 putative K domain-containing protein [Helianthus annuus]KAJ0543412.1 putative K domain-containing protein [Helianthus annuus]KAJ0708470.1 putative K domain-containing protein [Helianthus annuus]KAJ0894276.1 